MSEDGRPPEQPREKNPSADGANERTNPGFNPSEDATSPTLQQIQPSEPALNNEPTLSATPQEPGLSPSDPHDAAPLPSFMEHDPTPAWKRKLRALAERIRQSKWMHALAEKVQNFEPAKTAEWAGKTFQRKEAVGYGKAATIALCAFFLADLVALLVGRYIPEPPVARLNRPQGAFRRAKTLEDYNIVFTRNLFNRDGVIPGDEVQTGQPVDTDTAPVRTTLPFHLVGTLILQDEMRSIATIEDKSATMVYPVRATDEIPTKARILKVEPRKVTFINISNGRKEYVDLPDDGTLPPVQNPRVTLGAPRSGGGVEKVADNQFNVSRSEVDKALTDLNKVLTEARAVPNFENGVANGYKLFQIVPGSIYDKLGLKNGVIIQGLNGSPINDPGKAFEMLSELKTSSHLELQVKEDGKVVNKIYDIR
jgi:general secretion pathway protein C